MISQKTVDAQVYILCPLVTARTLSLQIQLACMACMQERTRALTDHSLISRLRVFRPLSALKLMGQLNLE